MGRRVVCLLGFIAACSGAPSDTDSTAWPVASAAATEAPPPGSVTPPVAHDPSWAACATRRSALEKEAALPGVPALADQAIHFARVRSRPTLWRRAPKTPAELEKLAKGKRSSVRLVRGIKSLLDRRGGAAERRATILSEGYLFADEAQMAVALTSQVNLVRLFEEPTLFLERGVDTYELARMPQTKVDAERYAYKGGAFDGERAEILFGDRVATSKDELASNPPLVVDLGDLVASLDADRLRPVRFTESALAADVRYGPGTWVPAVFAVSGAKATLACEALTPELATAKSQFVESHRLLRKALPRVREVVRHMVRERIPFDADDDETNGYLRGAWQRAYLAGWKTFAFSGESHDVYGPHGAPLPPEVCIDFLADVWERSSGSWYRAASGDPLTPKPERTKGGIDVDALGISNRRSVAAFTDYAQRHADLFDVWPIPVDERVPFSKRGEFFEYLAERADMFRPLDMITVGGLNEDGHPHYHSLIVLEVDPLTGIPTLVASNASYPREQSLEGILSISPKRTLRHRIRVTDAWLQAVVDAPAP